MDKELQKWMFRQFFIRAVILILVAIVISVVCISLKQQSTASQMKKLDKIYMNKYSLDLSALDFLDKREQEQYKKKFIQACEAYNLKQVTKIVIDEGSITYDKETNMYEWTIHCNDEKQTSFLSAYKKTTKDFTVERQYPEEEQSVEEIEQKNRERDEPQQEKTEALVAVPEGTRCEIKHLVYPDGNNLLQTKKQKNRFRKELEYWLGYENISSADLVQFEIYNEYGGKVLKKELLFQVQGSAPNRIKQISAVYDSEWQFSIIL